MSMRTTRRRSGPVNRAAVVVILVMTGRAGAAATAADRGVRVGPDLPVTATDVRVPEANNSPVLAQDPTEARFVAIASRLDGPDFGCALHLSGDGGRYWVPVQPVPELPPGAEKCYAPELAFDGEGTLYYLFVGLHGSGNSPMGAFLVTSSDRGRSFTPPRPILGGDHRQILGPYNYMVRMVIDQTVGSHGRIHLVWLHAISPPATGALPDGGNPILAAYSDDGGRTFSEPVQVSDPGRRRAVSPALAVGGDKAVHVAYYDLRDDAVDYQGLEGPTWEGEWSLVVATSKDGGKRFGGGVVVEDGVVPPGRVMLIFTMPPPAIAATGTRVYTAWPDGRHGDADVFFSRSDDGARSWQGPERLNDDRPGNGLTQSLPRLDVAPGGRVDAVFQDRRDDPANISSHIYYTFSTDGGRVFGPNTKLSSSPSDTRVGPTYPAIRSAQGLTDFGSRLGLLSGASSALVAWPDTRNGAVDGRQDIFSVRVAVPDTPGGRRWLPWAFGGVAALAGGAAGLGWRRRRAWSGA